MDFNEVALDPIHRLKGNGGNSPDCRCCWIACNYDTHTSKWENFSPIELNYDPITLSPQSFHARKSTFFNPNSPYTDHQNRINISIFLSTFLFLYLPKALKSATTSVLVSWNRSRFIDLRSNDWGSPARSKEPEKRILSAVPSPWTWSLPHTLHLSHPTQSMMRLMLRK